MQGMAATIVWFRLDTRLEDNPALHAAVQRGAPVVPLFIWSPDDEGGRAPGGASKYWLQRSLAVLSESIKACGARLVIRVAPTAREVLQAVINECGADAAPYFRIFSPASQGVKFDPNGDYVRTWVPELEKLDAKWIREPGRAPSELLSAAGVVLGKTYPKPIVDHAQTRIRALEAFAAIKG